MSNRGGEKVDETPRKVTPLNMLVREIVSELGISEKIVECETTEQFMNVLECCTSHLNDDQIEYADLAIYGKES